MLLGLASFTMLVRFIHIMSIIFVNFYCYIVVHCMNIPQFIFPVHFGHLDCFQLGTINCAAVNILVLLGI